VAFQELQAQGIAAGVVSHGPDMAERDEHLHARRAIAWTYHGELGRVPIVQCPVYLDGQRLAVRSAGPLLGQHTQQVLHDLIGLSEAEYRQLASEDAV